MKLLNLLTFFTGLAAAAPAVVEQRDGPSGHEVTITGFIFGGNGCPKGTARGILSSDLTTLTIVYDEFIAQSGPGIQPKERRKNCQLNVRIHFPQGWQFSIFKADYRGHVTLPPGSTGSAKATYHFSGSSQQISSTETFSFPRDQDRDYLKTDVFGVQSTIWSPCGREGMLNINSAIQLSPLDSTKAALLTSESTDLTFKQIHYLQWRKCTR